MLSRPLEQTDGTGRMACELEVQSRIQKLDEHQEDLFKRKHKTINRCCGSSQSLEENEVGRTGEGKWIKIDSGKKKSRWKVFDNFSGEMRRMKRSGLHQDE